MLSPEQIIKRPLMTEKTNRLKESGGGNEPHRGAAELDPEKLRRQVAFEVSREANKIEIRNAVEKLWKVNVVDVHTMVVRGKFKRVGRFEGRGSAWKKAVVTLAPGQNIEFFEGV